MDDSNAVGETMVVIEVCPYCDTENTVQALPDQMIGTCSNCGRRIVLCDKCLALNPDENARPCDNCKFCDLANFMNYLKGFGTVERFLGTLNPPLTDMTTGLPDGVTATLEDYMNDAYGDDVNWDVKYWDIYRLVRDCFLNANSSEEDCRDFVQTIIEKNNA